MTRTRRGWRFGTSDDSSNNCSRRRESLSRYLDNDLREREATTMAAHLRGCAACRAEFEAMRAQRAILSVAASPRGSAGARARVLNRFEQAVRAESDRKRADARSRVSRRPLFARSASTAVAVTTLLALTGVGTLFAVRSMRPASPAAAAPVAVRSATVPVLTPPALPQSGDLQAFFAQHDGSVTASTARTTAAPSRHIAAPLAATHAAPRHRSRIAANAPRVADSETAPTVSDEPTPIPSDEIPEAL